MLDRRLAFEILELDAQLRMGASGVLRETADVAFTLKDFEHVRTQLRSGRKDRVLLRLLAVADAGEHITQGVGHSHRMILTSSTSSGRG
jgi:hypothetical protein